MNGKNSKFSDLDHELFMRRCLELGAKGIGSVAPNPLVGALVVHQGNVIGEGFHERFGGAHAEVNAIATVKEREHLKSSTLYVNLEPCVHFGKTPPCVDLILSSGIPRVVVGCGDTYEKVAGRGIAKLREAGVEVLSGILLKESVELNRRFFLFHKMKRPYVILKWAETSDGFVAREDGSSRWISCEVSRRLVHQWRADESAVMVGTKTALVDNPKLTVRDVFGRNPVRIVIDRSGKLDPNSHLLDSSVRTIVFSEKKRIDRDNVTYCDIDFSNRALDQILSVLYSQGIQSVLIEGGATFHRSLIAEGLWDEARVFIAKECFGTGVRAAKLQGVALEKQSVGEDLLYLYRNPTSEMLLCETVKI